MRAIRRAAPKDADRLRDLLVRLDLRPEGIFAPDSAYWVVEAPSGDLIGAIGVETGEDAALLRSAGVLPEHQRHGIGAALVAAVKDHCRALGIPRLYCFSAAATTYWARVGFRRVTVHEIVNALPTAPQVLLFDQLGWLPTEAAWRFDLAVDWTISNRG